MKIYGLPSFNVMKVLFTAEELGLDYQYVALDISKGENKTPEYLAIHPLGKLPAIEHNGNNLFESNVICRYLASLQDSSLYSGDVMQKAGIDQWVDFFTQHIGRWMSVFFWQEVVKPHFFNQDTDPGAIAEAQEFLDQQLPVIEKQLADNAYLAGSQFSIADIVGFSYMEIHESTSCSIDAYPNIQKWYAKIKQRPAVQRAKRHLAN
jgi:glutathione S-transferase